MDSPTALLKSYYPVTFSPVLAPATARQIARLVLKRNREVTQLYESGANRLGRENVIYGNPERPKPGSTTYSLEELRGIFEPF